MPDLVGHDRQPAVLDAVIVGAGVSGLAVARRLQRAGKTVAVCEARDRVGGRLLSATLHGAGSVVDLVVDLGATWIWPGEARVMALVAELGLTTYAHFDSGVTLFDGPGGPRPLPGIDQSTPSLRVAGGTAAITDALGRELATGTVRLEHVVDAIVGAGDQLRVEIDGRSPLLARHVVLALPPALALDQITFDPTLPDELIRRAEVVPVWMGNIVKTVVVYPRPFWRSAGLAGTALSSLGPLDEIHDLCGPSGEPAALFGFSSLTRARRDPPKRDEVLAQLARLLGPEAGRPNELLQQDWSRERFTSPPATMTLSDHSLFGHAVLARSYGDGRVHFCSCETSGGSGHIEDALAAAERTVDAVLGLG